MGLCRTAKQSLHVMEEFFAQWEYFQSSTFRISRQQATCITWLSVLCASLRFSWTNTSFAVVPFICLARDNSSTVRYTLKVKQLDMSKIEHIYIELTLCLSLFKSCSNRILCYDYIARKSVNERYWMKWKWCNVWNDVILKWWNDCSI